MHQFLIILATEGKRGILSHSGLLKKSLPLTQRHAITVIMSIYVIIVVGEEEVVHVTLIIMRSSGNAHVQAGAVALPGGTSYLTPLREILNLQKYSFLRPRTVIV